MKPIKRPMLRWHGGKWLLAKWIISHFGKHRTYTEIYGGAASVLLQKPRSYSEVWNDLDLGVINLMELLRDGRGPDLVELLRITPFSRVEFERSYIPTSDPLESARKLIVRSFMGFGSDGHNAQVKTGFRADSDKSGTTPAHDWVNYPDALLQICERIRGVVIEKRPALQVLRTHDRPDCLHYVDPPYLPETRSSKSRKSGTKYHAYAHEMDVEDHVELLEALRTAVGMVVLSGYPSMLYDDILCEAGGWTRIERPSLADGARARTEVLWMNPSAVNALPFAPRERPEQQLCILNSMEEIL